MQRFSLLGAALLCSITASAADCNRACLKDTMTKYLGALVAQDPSKAPLAPNLRFTEDSKDLKAGEGLWKLATKLGDYRQDFIDVKQQVVLSHVIVEESGKPGEILSSRHSIGPILAQGRKGHAEKERLCTAAVPTAL